MYEEDGNSQSSGDVSGDADYRRLLDVARLSVDVASAFRGKYPDDILEAFTLVGKYMTIAGLSVQERQTIDVVTNSTLCPMCQFYLNVNDKCDGCVLISSLGNGCGRKYLALKNSIPEGTYTEIAYHIGSLVRAILNRRGYAKRT